MFWTLQRCPIQNFDVEVHRKVISYFNSTGKPVLTLITSDDYVNCERRGRSWLVDHIISSKLEGDWKCPKVACYNRGGESFTGPELLELYEFLLNCNCYNDSLTQLLTLIQKDGRFDFGDSFGELVSRFEGLSQRQQVIVSKSLARVFQRDEQHQIKYEQIDAEAISFMITLPKVRCLALPYSNISNYHPIGETISFFPETRAAIPDNSFIHSCYFYLRRFYGYSHEKFIEELIPPLEDEDTEDNNRVRMEHITFINEILSDSCKNLNYYQGNPISCCPQMSIWLTNR